MEIVLETRVYGLFLYLLIEKKWKESLFVFEENFYKKYDEKFKKKGIKVKKMKVNYSQNPFLYYKNKMRVFHLIQKSKNVWGDDALLYLDSFNKFNIIEDGTKNYENFELKLKLKDIIKRIIRLENPFYKPYGYYKRVKKIYLTGLAPIPEEIKHKVEIINLKELWNKKTKEEQEEILDIFDFNFEIVEILKQRKKILFTQPLSEDKIISEKEKIELYRKMLKNYDEKDVVIKIHPREITNYKKEFQNIVILEQKFPAELLNVLDIKFEKAITIFSTAACTLDKDIEVDFYGTEIHPKIFEKFGCHNHIYKTNCFI